MGDFRKLNADLARVLGVENISNVQTVTLVLSGGSLPTVTVERVYLPGASGDSLTEGFRAVLTMHQLAPSESKEVTPS